MSSKASLWATAEYSVFGDGTIDRFVLLLVTLVVVGFSWGTTLRFELPSEAAEDYGLALIAGACGVFLLLGLAAFIYALHPWWRTRGRRLVPIGAVGDRRLEVRLAELLSTVEVKPRVLVDPTMGQNALVFGFPWNSRLVLKSGLRLVLVKDRARFDAIVLHEIGHLSSRDLLITYFTRALSQAFVAASFAILAWWTLRYLWQAPDRWQTSLAVGYTALQMLCWDALSLAKTLGRYVIFFIVVGIENARLLRFREASADLWAAARGARESLMAIFLAAGPHAGRAGWWWLRAVHPSAAERAAFLADPSSLLAVRKADAFLIGSVAGLALLSLNEVVRMALMTTPSNAAMAPLPSGIIEAAWLVLGVICWAAAKTVQRFAIFRELRQAGITQGHQASVATFLVGIFVGGFSAMLLLPTTIARIDLWPDGVTSSGEWAVGHIWDAAWRLGATLSITAAMAIVVVTGMMHYIFHRVSGSRWSFAATFSLDVALTFIIYQIYLIAVSFVSQGSGAVGITESTLSEAVGSSVLQIATVVIVSLIVARVVSGSTATQS